MAMMAVTLQQREGTPDSWPGITGLSDAAAALDQAFLWQRIEAWVAWRWAARPVTWIVEGPGCWIPPLAPATITGADWWGDDAWHMFIPRPSPLGGIDLGYGHVRIVATVGAGPVPADVAQAFTRLAEYVVSESGGLAGTSSYGVNLGQISENYNRSPTWMARALEWSGAADLLRRYRRAG